MIIRTEEEKDRDAVYRINTMAFESPAEASLVNLLREQAEPYLALVAEIDQKVVGHIVFTPVTLNDHSSLKIMGLGPMAVLPEFQRRGVGSELVRKGMDQCELLGADGIIVLGHAEYYPRFGFTPASGFGITSTYDVPDEVFMAMELKPGALQGKSGPANYHPAFSQI